MPHRPIALCTIGNGEIRIIVVRRPRHAQRREEFPSQKLAVRLTGELLDQQGKLELKPDEDFYLWYAHFGPAHPQLAQDVSQLKGRERRIEDLRFGNFQIQPFTVDLGEQLPGDWRVPVPSELVVP